MARWPAVVGAIAITIGLAFGFEVQAKAGERGLEAWATTTAASVGDDIEFPVSFASSAFGDEDESSVVADISTEDEAGSPNQPSEEGNDNGIESEEGDNNEIVVADEIADEVENGDKSSVVEDIETQKPASSSSSAPITTTGGVADASSGPTASPPSTTTDNVSSLDGTELPTSGEEDADVTPFPLTVGPAVTSSGISSDSQRDESQQTYAGSLDAPHLSTAMSDVGISLTAGPTAHPDELTTPEVTTSDHFVANVDPAPTTIEHFQDTVPLPLHVSTAGSAPSMTTSSSLEDSGSLDIIAIAPDSVSASVPEASNESKVPQETSIPGITAVPLFHEISNEDSTEVPASTQPGNSENSTIFPIAERDEPMNDLPSSAGSSSLSDTTSDELESTEGSESEPAHSSLSNSDNSNIQSTNELPPHTDNSVEASEELVSPVTEVATNNEVIDSGGSLASEATPDHQDTVDSQLPASFHNQGGSRSSHGSKATDELVHEPSSATSIEDTDNSYTSETPEDSKPQLEETNDSAATEGEEEPTAGSHSLGHGVTSSSPIIDPAIHPSLHLEDEKVPDAPGHGLDVPSITDDTTNSDNAIPPTDSSINPEEDIDPSEEPKDVLGNVVPETPGSTASLSPVAVDSIVSPVIVEPNTPVSEEQPSNSVAPAGTSGSRAVSPETDITAAFEDTESSSDAINIPNDDSESTEGKNVLPMIEDSTTTAVASASFNVIVTSGTSAALAPELPADVFSDTIADNRGHHHDETEGNNGGNGAIHDTETTEPRRGDHSHNEATEPPISEISSVTVSSESVEVINENYSDESNVNPAGHEQGGTGPAKPSDEQPQNGDVSDSPALIVSDDTKGHRGHLNDDNEGGNGGAARSAVETSDSAISGEDQPKSETHASHATNEEVSTHENPSFDATANSPVTASEAKFEPTNADAIVTFESTPADDASPNSDQPLVSEDGNNESNPSITGGTSVTVDGSITVSVNDSNDATHNEKNDDRHPDKNIKDHDDEVDNIGVSVVSNAATTIESAVDAAAGTVEATVPNEVPDNNHEEGNSQDKKTEKDASRSREIDEDEKATDIQSPNVVDNEIVTNTDKAVSGVEESSARIVKAPGVSSDEGQSAKPVVTEMTKTALVDPILNSGAGSQGKQSSTAVVSSESSALDDSTPRTSNATTSGKATPFASGTAENNTLIIETLKPTQNTSLYSAESTTKLSVAESTSKILASELTGSGALILDEGGEAESYVRGQTPIGAGVTATGSQEAALLAGASGAGSDGDPLIIGGRKSRITSTQSGLYASSSSSQNIARYAACAASVFSIVLLVGFHLSYSDDRLKWPTHSPGTYWSPNTWEFITYVGYLQQTMALSPMTLMQTPYFLWEFTDIFAWSNLLVYQNPSSDASETRRLNVIILNSLVGYADRIGTDEANLIYTIDTDFVLAFGVVLAVALVLFGIQKYRKNSQTGMDATKPSVSGVRRVLSLLVLLWFFALFPLALIGAFEVSMEIQSSMFEMGPLLLSLLAMVAISGGGLSVAGRTLFQANTNKLNQPAIRATWGVLYLDHKHKLRLFFIFTAALQMVTGVAIGFLRSGKTLLVLLLVLHATYMLALYSCAPFKRSAALAQRFSFAATAIKMINLLMMFAFLESVHMSVDTRCRVARAFIVMNCIVIFVWLFRLLVIFCTCITVITRREEENKQNLDTDCEAGIMRIDGGSRAGRGRGSVDGEGEGVVVYELRHTPLTGVMNSSHPSGQPGAVPNGNATPLACDWQNSVTPVTVATML